jgi:hypothetical protein
VVFAEALLVTEFWAAACRRRNKIGFAVRSCRITTGSKIIGKAIV